MCRKLPNDVARSFLKNFQVVNDDTSHRGPEASKNVHGGPKLWTERFSIVFGLDLRRQTGVTKYIDTDTGNLDPHRFSKMPSWAKSATPDSHSLQQHPITGLWVGPFFFRVTASDRDELSC
jgi:hypothetical protein